uniref:Ig-like domain-containing protein n=1 Tax=Erpetoichthys calabaricus TaxID=27687 RepID=A0A8C4RMK4_ERPCA
ASPTAPTLFPLISTCGSVESNPISIGCLATGFTPSSLQFSWIVSTTEVVSYLKQYLIKYSDINGLKVIHRLNVRCQVFRFCIYICLPFSDQTPPMPPTLFIASPSKDEMHINKTATMVCVAKGFYPKAHTFTWLKNDKPITSDINDCPEALTPNSKLYHASSMLTIASSEWKSQYNNYTCVFEVNHDTRQKVKQVVYLDGPNFEEPPNKLTATCSVVGPNLDGVVISWTVGSADRTPLKTVNPIDNGNGTQTVWSKLDISEDWKQGNEIVCHVSDALSNINEPILKIMRPPEYDLTEGKADLICIITNFFPSDISVKWIKNQTDVSNTQFVNDCPVQNGSVFSMVSRLKINEEDLKTAASFTCMVNHYYSNEWKRVDSPSNLFGM